MAKYPLNHGNLINSNDIMKDCKYNNDFFIATSFRIIYSYLKCNSNNAEKYQNIFWQELA